MDKNYSTPVDLPEFERNKAGAVIAKRRNLYLFMSRSDLCGFVFKRTGRYCKFTGYEVGAYPTNGELPKWAPPGPFHQGRTDSEEHYLLGTTSVLTALAMHMESKFGFQHIPITRLNEVVTLCMAEAVK